MCWPGPRPCGRLTRLQDGGSTRKDTRQKGSTVCEFEGFGPVTQERVLQAVRSLAAKRPDGLMTSDQLCKSLGAHPADVDVCLRQLERSGAIFVSPSAGRIAIVVLGDGDDRALRRTAHPEAGTIPGKDAGFPGSDVTPPRGRTP
jgi:hypothetical protein